MASNNVTISKVTSETDFPLLVRLEDEAYGVSQMLALLFGADTAAERDAPVRTARYRQSWSKDPACAYIKAMDPSGEIVGFAVWYFYTKPSQSRNPWEGIEGSKDTQPLRDQYFGRLVETRERWMGHEATYALLANMVVKPEWQRRGIGSRLLTWGIKQADGLGLPCWLNASPQGLGLYLKHGWREAETLTFDLSAYGGAAGQTYRTVGMKRAVRVSE